MSIADDYTRSEIIRYVSSRIEDENNEGLLELYRRLCPHACVVMNHGVFTVNNHPEGGVQREDVIEQVAKSCFADEWANAVDEARGADSDNVPNLSGCEIFDVCPFDKMPEEYRVWAREYVDRFENANPDLCDYADAILDIVSQQDDIETSAHYLYMQAVGHGVGLWDQYDLDRDDEDAVNVPSACTPLIVVADNIDEYL